jgi:hypothetical protein
VHTQQLPWLGPQLDAHVRRVVERQQDREHLTARAHTRSARAHTANIACVPIIWLDRVVDGARLPHGEHLHLVRQYLRDTSREIVVVMTTTSHTQHAHTRARTRTCTSACESHAEWPLGARRFFASLT